MISDKASISTFEDNSDLLEKITSKKNYCLFFDTETSSLFWPRLVQIAWILADEQNIIDTGNYIIKPKGFSINPQATEIHGITTERAREEGHDLQEILKKFEKRILNASLIICHNTGFDIRVMKDEYRRKEMKRTSNKLENFETFCTMRQGKKILGLQKNPKLGELYQRFFQKQFDGAHNAVFDTLATFKCYFHLLEEQKKLPLEQPETETKKPQKTKSDEDENSEPKKPKKGFFRYLSIHYQTMKEQNPNKNMIKITKLISSKWKLLKQEEKDEMDKQYEKELKQWEFDHKQWSEKNNTPEKNGKLKNLKKDNENTVKRGGKRNIKK